MPNRCLICRESTIQDIRCSRSESKINLNYCRKCDFLFSKINKKKSLSINKLDKTRLYDAGLEIPSLEDDFNNGSKQSAEYYKHYLEKENNLLNILEIGCSWGYFLTYARKKGHKVTGVEINLIRKDFLEKKLNIKCHENIEELIKINKTFDKIFLFYVIEYINNPIYYFQKILNLLTEKGEIIIITPNKNDAITELWSNEAYKKFIIDEHVVNYFSITSIENLISNLENVEAEINCKQGYSFYNHLKWFFINKPSTTGVVGGDNFTKDLSSVFERFEDSKYKSAGNELQNFIETADLKYKKLLEDNGLGNQIIIKLKKKT